MPTSSTRIEKLHLILDSGAFSAWSKGKVIDIDAYIDFVKKNQASIAHCVNLDVIPGQRGKKRTQDDVEKSAEQSFKNWQYMRSKGVESIPVFHEGERFEHLDRYVEEGATYIGISPMADHPTPVIRRWLDQVFTRITDEKGKPLIKTHGFGVTGFDIMLRYPWTTVDSATWILIAVWGHIFVPPYRHGTADYTTAPLNLVVSQEARKVHDSEKHVNGLGPIHKRYVLQFLKEVGTDLLGVTNDYRERMRCTAYYFKYFSDSNAVPVFRHRLRTL